MFLLILAALLSQQPAAAQSSAFPEYRVKATFLFQFTQFVDWPAQVLPDSKTPLVIGVFGKDPFGSSLDETVRGEKANDHPLAVERYQHLEEIKNCHVLFVSRAEAGRIHEIAAAVRGRGVLIVGDAEGFADAGGIIQFVIQDNKIRLKINLTAARAANLTISSKLLRPAILISPEVR